MQILAAPTFWEWLNGAGAGPGEYSFDPVWGGRSDTAMDLYNRAMNRAAAGGLPLPVTPVYSNPPILAPDLIPVREGGPIGAIAPSGMYTTQGQSSSVLPLLALGVLAFLILSKR